MTKELEKILNEGMTQEQRDMLKKKRNIKFPLYCRQSFLDSSIDEMNLSVRSYNCLKRAGLHTVGDLIESVNNWSDLLKIRNMGTKSAKEVIYGIFVLQYNSLKPNEQKIFLAKTVAMNA